MTTMFQTFGGNPIQPANSNYAQIALSQNTSLSWPIQFQNTLNNLFNWMDVTPSNNGFVLTLPNATLVSPGSSAIFNNPTGFTFTLNKFDGTLLYNFGPGITRYFLLQDTSTTGGNWYNVPFAGGLTAVTSVNMTSSSNNVVIGGVPITGAGTITLTLANDLQALSSFGVNTGLACRTAANTWNLRQVSGTANQIAITNPKGIAGDITVALATDITGVNSIVVNNVSIQNNSISTTGANQNLILAPNGTGLVNIQGEGLEINNGKPIFFYADDAVHWTSLEGGNQTVDINLILPTVAPTINQILGYAGANQLGWFNVTTFGGPSTATALARYSDTIGSLENSTVLLDSTGNITNTTSIAIGNLLIGGTGGLLPNQIVSTNVNGNIYFGPNGTGAVFSTGNINLSTQHAVNFYELAGASNFVGFAAPGALPNGSYTYNLPQSIPLASQVLITTSGGNPGPAALTHSYMSSDKNLLVNGDLSVWQRGTNFTNASTYLNNDNQYCADQWKLLSNGNNTANITRVAGPTNLATAGSTYAWRFTVATINQKFGMCQIKESINSVDLIGNTVVLSCTARGTGAGTTFKMAVIGWSGAANSPTSDPIAAWNGTGVDPTLAANWAYQGATIAKTLTGNYVTYASSAITIGAGVNNVGVLIWCDSAAAALNDTMDVTSINLTKGSNYTPFYPEDFYVTLFKSKRFFRKDFRYSVNPFTATTVSNEGLILVSPIAALITVANTDIYGSIIYDVEMSDVIAITVTTYPYTTVTNTGRCSDDTGTDQPANSCVVTNSSPKGFQLQNTSGGNITAHGYFLMHYTSSAEF